jgi:hypothetical protein
MTQLTLFELFITSLITITIVDDHYVPTGKTRDCTEL